MSDDDKYEYQVWVLNGNRWEIFRWTTILTDAQLYHLQAEKHGRAKIVRVEVCPEE